MCFLLVLGLVVMRSVPGAAQMVRNANAFLDLQASARSEALAHTDLAWSYSLGMERVNPAALADMEHGNTVGGSFLSHFSDMGRMGYLSYAHRLDSISGLAVSLLRFSVEGIPNTLHWMDIQGMINYNRITYFSVADYALYVGYGREFLTPGLSFGGSLKLVSRDEGDFAHGLGLGVDIGVRYARPRWSVAAVLRNATTTWTMWFMRPDRLEVEGQEDEEEATGDFVTEGSLPSLDLGGGYSWLLGEGDWALGLNGAATIALDGADASLLSKDWFNLNLFVGVDAHFKDLVFIGAGFRQFQLIDEGAMGRSFMFTPSFGVGVQTHGFGLHYAFSAPMALVALRTSHLVSFSYAW